MKTAQHNVSTIKAMVDPKNEIENAPVTALKIDVINRKITKIEFSDYESPCVQLDCYLVDHWTMNQFNDTLIVDDEGWLESKPSVASRSMATISLDTDWWLVRTALARAQTRG